MIITKAITIKTSVDTVLNHFFSKDCMKHCHKGFVDKQLLTGELNATGSTNKLIYTKFEMIEIIVKNNLPERFFAQYEHAHVSNTMLIKLQAVTDTTTELYCEVEYTAFKGFMVKWMAKLFPKVFKKQIDEWLIRFKNYVEKHD